jgi:hypothetical protein
MYTFEDYCSFYNFKNYLPNNNYKRKNRLNINQLKTQYEKYLQAEEKKVQFKQRYISKNNDKIQQKIDNNEFEDKQWIEVCKQVDIRDNNKCRLIKVLSYIELQELKTNVQKYMLEQIDHAHIISRGNDSSLIYVVENIICLNRYSHSNLDQYRNPINGKQIDKDEWLNWWYKIVGIDFYNKLLEKTK